MITQSIASQNDTCGAVTAQHDFHEATPNGDCLFSVRAGIPLSDAFVQLSLLLGASISTVSACAVGGMEENDMKGALWQSVHLLNVTFALVQSMHGGFTEPQGLRNTIASTRNA